jgi:hypothetical protein
MKSVRFANRAELNAAIIAGAFKGKAVHCMVLHDPQCTPESCTCEPEFRVEELTVENYCAGQRAQEDWKRNSGA